MAKKLTQIYQFKVSLDDTHPPIWRRIQVPGNTTLLKLHDILQIGMGWQDSHLHAFTIDGLSYGNPEDDEFGDLGTLDEAKYALSRVINGEGQRFTYEYDFGDSWDHTLLVEKILPPEEGTHYPLCLKGKRACPPEDVGGIWGYKIFLEAIYDPAHAEHEEYLAWVGGEFSPDAFDLDEINTRLGRMGRGRSAEALNAWSVEEVGLEEKETDLSFSGLQTLADDQQAVAENLPLRRDIITLLTYLRDKKVIGTTSTGNLTLKAVHEICAQFVNPLKLEEAVGEYVYKIRSETEVWPLYFRHMLASAGGLVSGGMGRRWRVSPLGEHFLAIPAPLQVRFLFASWWTHINWVIASPFGYDDGYLPPGFSKLTLTYLLDLPGNALTSFEPFADRLIDAAELVWPIESQERAHSILLSVIERIVINPLVEFGILAPEYRPDKILGKGYQELTAFQVTHFGREFLEAIGIERP